MMTAMPLMTSVYTGSLVYAVGPLSHRPGNNALGSTGPALDELDRPLM